MGLLDLLMGADAARQFRERMTAAQATAQAAVRAAGATPADPAAAVRPAGSATAVRTAPRSNPAGSAALSDADPLGLAGLDGSDFPTSILATAVEPAPPLLAAFANRPSLLAAIVFSEALAPPVALR